MVNRTILVTEVDDALKFIDAQTVFETVDQIRATGKEEAFFAACREKRRGMVVSREDANFIKAFLAEFANLNLLEGRQSRETRALRTAIRRTATSGPRC